MLQGAENIDCFCDYTPTFSNVGERESICVSPFLSLFVRVCVFAIYVCMVVCAFVHVCGSNRGRMERRRRLPEEGWKGKRGVRGEVYTPR